MPLRIAILGTRGIPAAYGGFETFAWELSTRLADRGHDVTVYCRRGWTDESVVTPPGVTRRFLPFLPGKYPATVSHAALSVLDSLVRSYDVIWLGNAANAIFAGVPRIRGTAVALNVDGIERQRAKWGLAGRLWYALGERCALVYPNVIVSDAEVIRSYYRERYRKDSVLIAYGAAILDRTPPPDLGAYGIQGVTAGRYILYVSRLEPENQAHLVIEAYRAVPGDVPLLIVGDAPYATDYKRRLGELAVLDPRVRLVGAVYGQCYRDLQRAALAYVQATSVGGTHPALVESMGAGNLTLAFETPENVEVLAGTGLTFGDAAALTSHLTGIVQDPGAPEFERLRSLARDRARAVYSWDAVTDQYEQLFRRLAARRVSARTPA